MKVTVSAMLNGEFCVSCGKELSEMAFGATVDEAMAEFNLNCVPDGTVIESITWKMQEELTTGYVKEHGYKHPTIMEL